MGVSNEFIVVGLFFFFVSWGFTTAFIRSGAFFKCVIFFISTSLFITLEHLNSIELTVISFLGAVTAYYGGIMSMIFSMRNMFFDCFYGTKDFFTQGLYLITSMFYGMRRGIFSIFSLFKTKEDIQKNTSQSYQSQQKSRGKNRKNAFDDEAQSRRAKEQFRQAREDAEKKRVEEESKKNRDKTENQDNRSFEEILGVQDGYTKGELKIAYKRVALRFHPDKYSHMSEVFRLEAEEEFKKIQRAYSILLRPFS